jgi:hypothetical protein
MSSQNPISLGDVARIKKVLAPKDARTWNCILRMLGLPLEIAEPSGGDAMEAETGLSDSTVVEAQDAAHEQEEYPSAPPQRTTVPVFAPEDAITLQPVVSSVAAPEWNNAKDILWAMNDGSASVGPPPPLFAPGQERSLITAVAIALAETGELDEERAAEQTARGEPLRRIPLRLRPTSRFGVQVLVDWGARLQPLREDQQGLLVTLFRTVGAHRVEVRRFSDFPDFSGPGTRRTWTPYEPPASGTVVLILTDLGLGWLGRIERTHRVEDWMHWAAKVRSAGARPIALVPHGPQYWSEGLRRNLPLVHWDRTTTVGSIRGAYASWNGRT